MDYIWHVQEGTNLIQNEVMTLKEVGFVLFGKSKCHPKIIFGDDASIHVNKLVDANVSLKI
jgi:hypothetical protein